MGESQKFEILRPMAIYNWYVLSNSATLIALADPLGVSQICHLSHILCKIFSLVG